MPTTTANNADWNLVPFGSPLRNPDGTQVQPPSIATQNPFTALSDVGKVLGTFFGMITDAKLWRSLGWLLLGVLLTGIGLKGLLGIHGPSVGQAAEVAAVA